LVCVILGSHGGENQPLKVMW